jgi:hypothetical protein
MDELGFFRVMNYVMRTQDKWLSTNNASKFWLFQTVHQTFFCYLIVAKENQIISDLLLTRPVILFGATVQETVSSHLSILTHTCCTKI